MSQISTILDKIENDLQNPQIFSRESSVEYIRNLTEAAYNLSTNEIYPDTATEQDRFSQNRKIWMEKLFRIQLLLREKLFEFNAIASLGQAEVAAFRNGNMYLSYAQDFVLMEWSLTQNLKAHESLFAADFPVTLKNPACESFQLKPGDIILVRGGSFISATIARAGDYLSNFSHVAMVIEDPDGRLSVAEALLEEGLIVYSIEKYLSLEKLSRAAVIRPQDFGLGQSAARAGFKIVDDDFRSPVRKAFDLLMNPKSRDKTYCFKLIIMAYDEGSKSKLQLPAFPMSFKKALAGNSFYTGLGNVLELGAAPDDAFFQPEFDVIMVHRDISQIKMDWAFDVAMSSLFEFINEKYSYKRKLKAFLLAKVAVFLKNRVGIQIKQIPGGVSANVIQLILEHKDIATQVQKHLMKRMAANPRPIAYKELEQEAHSFLDMNKEKFFQKLASVRF